MIKLTHPLTLAADVIAEATHQGQMRKWAEDPYIVHPRRVAALASELDGTDHIDCTAALLHDVLEDTALKDAGDLAKRLNEATDYKYKDNVDQAVRLVVELTKDYPDDEERSMSRAEKRERDWVHLRAVSDRAKRLKMCDRLDNITGGPMPSGMREKYKSESTILAEICGAVDSGLHKRLLAAIEAM